MGLTKQGESNIVSKELTAQSVANSINQIVKDKSLNWHITPASDSILITEELTKTSLLGSLLRCKSGHTYTKIKEVGCLWLSIDKKGISESKWMLEVSDFSKFPELRELANALSEEYLIPIAKEPITRLVANSIAKIARDKGWDWRATALGEINGWIIIKGHKPQSWNYVDLGSLWLKDPQRGTSESNWVLELEDFDSSEALLEMARELSKEYGIRIKTELEVLHERIGDIGLNSLKDESLERFHHHPSQISLELEVAGYISFERELRSFTEVDGAFPSFAKVRGEKTYTTSRPTGRVAKHLTTKGEKVLDELEINFRLDR